MESDEIRFLFFCSIAEAGSPPKTAKIFGRLSARQSRKAIGARVCGVGRVSGDREPGNAVQLHAPPKLRLIEPRSEKFARPATIPGDTDRQLKTYRHLAIAPALRGALEFSLTVRAPALTCNACGWFKLTERKKYYGSQSCDQWIRADRPVGLPRHGGTRF